jgi:four helix bundle protein
MKIAHNFRELKIWKEGILLTKEIYLLSLKLPDDEKFGLKSQIKRSSSSIPTNIAEGSGRGTEKDFNNFLNMSLGSAYELETQLILINLLFEINSDEVILKINDLQRMIIGFKKSLGF